MKKVKRFMSAAICTALTASMITGCGALGVRTIQTGLDTEKPSSDPDVKEKKIKNNTTDDFNKALVEYMENGEYAKENYMVSPTSLRAALALAVAGADTETKKELIEAMGFNDMDEVNSWYDSVSQIITDFDSYIKEDKKIFESEKEWLSADAKAPEGSLIMMNSIWNNTDLNGRFGKDYIKYVQKNYNAKAFEVTSDQFTEKANKLVSDGTNGLIPKISDDLSDVNAALINTLYLKSSWVKAFEKYSTSQDYFTTLNGKLVTKEYMNQEEQFSFYEDSNGKLIVLPLNGGVNAVFVLGDIADIKTAMDKATYEDVIVKLPKFEIETSFSDKELIDFLEKRGAELAFTDKADFSVMCPDTSWMIDDIIQKTKIKVDEDGLEAAAATAILMCESALFIEDKPKEFIADHPFKFYIVGGDDNSEVLFCGQVVE